METLEEYAEKLLEKKIENILNLLKSHKISTLELEKMVYDIKNSPYLSYANKLIEISIIERQIYEIIRKKEMIHTILDDILYYLELYSFLPSDELGKKLGISKEDALNLSKILEEEGFVEIKYFLRKPPLIKLKKSPKLKKTIVKPTYKDIVESYVVECEKTDVLINIDIVKTKDFVLNYVVNIPLYKNGTYALIKYIKNLLIKEGQIPATREYFVKPKEKLKLKDPILERIKEIMLETVKYIDTTTLNIISSYVLLDIIGLGKLEFFLSDKNLEDITINSPEEPIWVYHKKYGWLKTNVYPEDNEEIRNYASIIARSVGRQITYLNPILDANTPEGNRANATLFPISSKGNTLTIRKFRLNPWTITELIENKTISSEVAALIWLAMEYELNIIISGGTAAGKTTFLNAILPFVQPNHRIITIEDTRELRLPSFLQWVPLVTREANIEGRGEVKMLDLLVSSLRMRPDRIVLGEIRRKKEAEVLFEAMRTGHSAYATIHANTAEETIRRLINPPIALPVGMLEALHLNVVVFRNRRTKTRRIIQIAELLPESRGGKEALRTNVLYRWRSGTDKLTKANDSIRLIDEINLHASFTEKELKEDLGEKTKILNWMVKNKIVDLETIGKIISLYYTNKEELLSLIKRIPKTGGVSYIRELYEI